MVERRHYKVKGWELFIFVLDPRPVFLQTAQLEIELDRGGKLARSWSLEIV